MPENNRSGDLAGQILRSITTVTGALAAGLGVAVPILAGTYYESAFGRPSSTSAIAIPVAFILGILAAVIGGAVGWGIHQAVARSRWAGPVNRRVAAILVMLAVAIPSAAAILTVRGMEAHNRPRVIRATGQVERGEGRSGLAPVRSATFLWVGSPHPDHPTGTLR